MRIRPEPRRVPLARRDLHGRAGVGRAARPTSRRRSRRTPSSSATAPGFLLESVEHGERWSRFSFVGRDPGGHAAAARRPGRGHRHAAASRCPTDRGILAVLEHLLATYRAPVIPELPPLHGGLMGYLGYDVIREVERLPERPPRRPPRARRGDEHDRLARRLRPLAPAGDADRERAGARPRRRRHRRRLRRRGRLDRAGRRQPRPAAAVRAGRAAGGGRGAARRQELDARRAVPAGRRGGQGAHRRRRHLPGRAGPALRPRSSTPTRSTSTGCCARSTRARTCTSCATRS